MSYGWRARPDRQLSKVASKLATTRSEPAALGPGDHSPPAPAQAPTLRSPREGERNSSCLGKARCNPEGIGLRKAGFDPVGDAGVLPDQGVGSHAQGLRLIVAADLDDDQVRLARDPPAGVAVYRDFLHRRTLLHPFEDEARDEVATELGDEPPDWRGRPRPAGRAAPPRPGRVAADRATARAGAAERPVGR